MRRSEINAAIHGAERLFRDLGVHLPPFAAYAPEDWHARHRDLAGILIPRLGWDVTDFGRGRFSRCGLTLFTLRNGLGSDRVGAPPPKPYAEKLLVVREGQATPMHTHRRKIEDIIHRGGIGELVLHVRSAADDGGPGDAPVAIWTDGIERVLGADDRIRLRAGESVTLRPGDFHAFWAEGGTVLAAEVSSVNDDATDNVFVDGGTRFSAVEEDDAAYRLLVSDYPRLEEGFGAEEIGP